MDPKNILTAIKQASPFDLFLLSFLLLPFVFSAWVDVATKLKLEPQTMWVVLAAVLLLYIFGLISTLLGTIRVRKRETARDQIIQYLSAKGFEMMSFDRIRSNIARTYSDDFLESLTIHFPNDLRRAKLKGAKPGLARIIEATGQSEEQ